MPLIGDIGFLPPAFIGSWKAEVDRIITAKSNVLHCSPGIPESWSHGAIGIDRASNQEEMLMQVVISHLATPPGFEPGTSAPKADVLPLHHGATFTPATSCHLPGGLLFSPPATHSVKGMQSTGAVL